jgi:DNA-binding transcriptional MerR regulator
LLGVSVGTLHNYRMKGLLPYKMIKGSIFYAHQDVIRFLNRRNGGDDEEEKTTLPVHT